MTTKNILLLLISILLISCNGKTGKNTAEQMLTAFYTQYIAEQSKPQPDEKVILALYDKFLTAELREKLEQADLYDPFLNAQDCDENWIKSLKINPVEVAGQENAWKMCYSYTDFRGEQTNCITLFLVKQNGSYRINDIENFSNALSNYWDNYHSENDNEKEKFLNNSSNLTDSCSITIDSKNFNIIIWNYNCLEINGKDYYFQKCYDDMMVSISEKNEENALSLTFISGKHAIDITFYLKSDDWYSNFATFYPQYAKPITKSINVNLKDFDFSEVSLEIDPENE